MIDITIDGADEVDNQLNAIKGGGACHLREKVGFRLSIDIRVMIKDVAYRSWPKLLWSSSSYVPLFYFFCNT